MAFWLTKKKRPIPSFIIIEMAREGLLNEIRFCSPSRTKEMPNTNTRYNEVFLMTHFYCLSACENDFRSGNRTNNEREARE